VFEVGLAEGQWPRGRRGSLFVDHDQRVRLGWMSDTAQRELDWIRFLAICDSAVDQLILSMPSLQGDTPVLPSHFLTRLEKLLGKEDVIRGDDFLTEKSLSLYLASLSPVIQNRIFSEFRGVFPDFVLKLDRVRQDVSLADKGAVLNRSSVRKRWAEGIVGKDFSASQLEGYQRCPAHYFYSNVLDEKRLLEDPEQSLPQIWGVLVHQIFCLFYEGIYQKKDGQIIQEDPVKTRERLFGIARQVFESTAQDSFSWDIKKDLLFGDDQNKGLLDLFLDEEGHLLTMLKPVDFEKSFQGIVVDQGLDAELVLKGVLDVVLGAGGLVAVMDYKTGKRLVTAGDVRAFRSLQIPLYIFALKSLYPDKAVAGGLLYQVHHQNRLPKPFLIMNLIQ
jgi:ATP-dependent helicase/DNAse subunit B